MGFVDLMHKRPGKNTVNQNVFSVVQAVTGAEGPFVVKPPSTKGGKARAEKLTPEERKKIAAKAAKKRWG